jgi:hypothetical protein
MVFIVRRVAHDLRARRLRPRAYARISRPSSTRTSHARERLSRSPRRAIRRRQELRPGRVEHSARARQRDARFPPEHKLLASRDPRAQQATRSGQTQVSPRRKFLPPWTRPGGAAGRSTAAGPPRRCGRDGDPPLPGDVLCCSEEHLVAAGNRLPLRGLREVGPRDRTDTDRLSERLCSWRFARPTLWG